MRGTFQKCRVDQIGCYSQSHTRIESGYISSQVKHLTMITSLVAGGLELAFDQIEGMTPDLIGRKWHRFVFTTRLKMLEGTWREINQFVQNGGSGIFTRGAGCY